MSKLVTDDLHLYRRCVARMLDTMPAEARRELDAELESLDRAVAEIEHAHATFADAATVLLQRVLAKRERI